MIDTLQISERYLKAKTEEQKAKLIAHLFHEMQEEHLKNVATKSDILTLRNELKEDIVILKGNMNDIKTDIKEYITLCTIIISLGMAALAFLITYIRSCS